jgi:hypothetical protein
MGGLNRLLSDELRWYESQEVIWTRIEKSNQTQLTKLNREILSMLHLYGELDQEKAKNAYLQEQNARLQFEVDKLKLDTEAYDRIQLYFYKVRDSSALNCEDLKFAFVLYI